MFFSTNNNKADEVLQALDSIEEFIKGNINKIPNKKQIEDKNLKKINEKIISISNLLNEKNVTDLKVFGEMMLVCEKLSDGYTNDNIAEKSTDEKINYIAYSINEAINNIANSLKQVIDVLAEYQKNDYRSSINENIFRGGQFRELLKGINDLQQTTTKRILDAYKIGLTMEHQSKILSSEVSKLTQSTERQAEAVKETVLSIENISSSIHSNTQATQEMSHAGQLLKGSADQSLSMIEETKKTMEHIDTSTDAVNEATRAISQIAFQTNILSLNAAVEAATAGEAGKGFAVVAQEVRNLANRSAEVANTIQELMNQLKAQTSLGKNSALGMDKEFQILNENIQITLKNIDQIAQTSKEQNNNIQDINRSMKYIDEATEANTKAVQVVNTISLQSHNVAHLLVEANKDVNFEGKDAMGTPDAIIKSIFTKKRNS